MSIVIASQHSQGKSTAERITRGWDHPVAIVMTRAWWASRRSTEVYSAYTVCRVVYDFCAMGLVLAAVGVFSVNFKATPNMWRYEPDGEDTPRC